MFDQFFLRIAVPNKVGKTLYFPTVQRCAKGVHRWIEIPQKGKPEPESPAPGCDDHEGCREGTARP